MIGANDAEVTKGRGLAVVTAFVAGTLLGFVVGSQVDLGRGRASDSALVGTWEGGEVLADGSVEDGVRISFRADDTATVTTRGQPSDEILYALDGDRIRIEPIDFMGHWGFSLVDSTLTIAMGDVQLRLRRVPD